MNEECDIEFGIYLKPDGRVMLLDIGNHGSGSYWLWESSEQYQEYLDSFGWRQDPIGLTPAQKLKVYLESCTYLGPYDITIF